VSSRTFIAHVRYATTGALKAENTHPFEQRGLLFAHNGVIEQLHRLEQHLGDAMSLVHGDTDSERFFALISKEAEGDEDVGRAIIRGATWIADNLPIYALNIILIGASELWALRYPDVHNLYVLERAAGGPTGQRHLEHASARGSIRVRAGDLAHRPAVVVATEPMDEDPGWRELRSGELLHVDSNLHVTSTRPLDRPPAHQLTLADLNEKAAAAQAPSMPG
jgi:glutamine amidotransferase